MGHVFRRRPSASMVVAIIALVLAASGTAIAAGKLVNGDKLIKKGTLSGNRLRRHTLTGTQINLKKLGTVPSAKNAANATNATNATNAINATTAGNAAQLGGQPASSFLASSSRIGTNGIVKAAATSAGTTTTLFTVGPFTIKMTCTNTGTGAALNLFASSSEANSVLDGKLVAAANTSTDLGNNTDINATTSFAEADDVNIDFEAPSGAQAVLIGADGVNSLGTDCWANWAGIH